MKNYFSKGSQYLLPVLMITVFVLAGCAAPPASTTYTIETMSAPGIGNYLTDGNGMTLYYFTKDTVGNSNATDAIIAIWPVFYADKITVPSMLKASDFSTITRADGKMQTTFMGYPLYYYVKDMKAGDVLGQGINGVWFVVNPQNFQPPK